MKSFIRQDIYNTIDFEGTRLGKINEQYKSITGDPLNLLGKLNASIKFIGSRYSYSDNFLIKTRVCAKAVSNATHLSGVVESGATTNEIPDCGMENGTDSYLLNQSQYKAPI